MTLHFQRNRSARDKYLTILYETVSSPLLEIKRNKKKLGEHDRTPTSQQSKHPPSETKNSPVDLRPDKSKRIPSLIPGSLRSLRLLAQSQSGLVINYRRGSGRPRIARVRGIDKSVFSCPSKCPYASLGAKKGAHARRRRVRR